MNQAKIRYDQVKEFVNKQKSTMDLNVLEENIKILQLKVQQIENSMSKRNQLFIEQQKLIEKRSKSKEKLFRLNQSIQSKHSFHFVCFIFIYLFLIKRILIFEIGKSTTTTLKTKSNLN